MADDIDPVADPAPATPATPAVDPAAPAATIVTPATPAADPAAPAADPAAPAAPDWRAKLAGDDKDFAKLLGRYSDEAAFGKAHRALQAKLSSGEFKKALPEGATPEETATWRKENGIPDKPEGYLEKLELPEGLVIGEADKPIVAEFAAAALAGNMDTKQLSGLVAKYYEIQDAKQAMQEDADAEFKKASEDALRADWEGPDFRRNLTAVNNLVASWPEEVGTAVLAARSPDGRKLGDDPRFIKQLAAIARELNPVAPLVPAGTTDATKTAQGELDEIRKFARENPDAYERDHKMQARQTELIGALDKVKSRAA